ncbi:hypothetical protein Taro_006776 [Colocasia esculenta]|uniref:Uncharacterized protein n=1 Tax=Colocasia esculenta TaxID=4460 RepID=A0A843TPM3_COLES|nr:hypothetical protein [Colocasia esculenta]
MEACGEACSRHGKLVWSGRNAKGSSYCAFFAECARGFLCVAGSTTPTVVTSPVGCRRFSMSQAVSSGFVSARTRRRFRYRPPVQGRTATVLGQRL